MTLALQILTLEEYLTYDAGTDTRYELVDGVLVDMGAENTINPQIVSFLFAVFLGLGIPHYRLVVGHQIAVSSFRATSRQPDFMVHSQASEAAISADGKLLRLEMPAPALVVEVVSSSETDKKSRDRDYFEKRAEYAARGIPEYWIVDPEAGLITICSDNNLGGINPDTGSLGYRSNEFRGDMVIVSPQFPELKLTARQILEAGR
jgi:Uma2 family endonuclease